MLPQRCRAPCVGKRYSACIRVQHIDLKGHSTDFTKDQFSSHGEYYSVCDHICVISIIISPVAALFGLDFNIKSVFERYCYERCGRHCIMPNVGPSMF